MISNNNTNLNLSFHPPNPCLLLLPRSLMLPPPPFPSPSPYPYASIYIQLPHTDTDFFRFYRKVWANKKVFTCILLHWRPSPINYTYKVRLHLSDLNQDLVSRHVSNDPSSKCGAASETVEHYLLHCPLYTQVRDYTIQTLPPNRRSSEIQGTALGKCLQAWPVYYIQVHACGCSAE